MLEDSSEGEAEAAGAEAAGAEGEAVEEEAEPAAESD